MHHLHPPATHNRGSAPIDGIFILITLLEHCQTGYLAFKEAVPSNHWAVWIDIPAHRVCPTKLEAITRSTACWLQCKDPHTGKIQPTIMGTIGQNRHCSQGPGITLGNKKLLHSNTTAGIWKDRSSSHWIQTICRKPLQENPRRRNPMVPKSITHHKLNIILERAMELTEQMQNWRLHP